MKPEGSNVSYRDLAERFYALDTEVDSMNFCKKEPNSRILTETDSERF